MTANVTSVVRRITTVEEVVTLDEPAEGAPRGWVVVPRCRVEGCKTERYGSAGFCRSHYMKLRRGSLPPESVVA